MKDAQEQVVLDRYIFLVEDNPDDEALTKRALLQNNILNRLEVARDGAEALEWISGIAEQSPKALPALTLLDLKLPKVDGLEVLRRLRSDHRTQAMPVVVLTSSKEEEDVIAAYRLGSNAYVRKPVSFADFAEAVNTLGLFWLLLNEPPPPVIGDPSTESAFTIGTRA